MEKIWFYGAGKIGTQAYGKIALDSQAKQRFAGFIDSGKAGCICQGERIVSLEQTSIDDIVVITVAKNTTSVEIYDLLHKRGYKKIFWYQGSKQEKFGGFLDECCESCVLWGDIVLPKAEIHVVDFCNLNCRGCAHYSPIFKREYPKTEDRIHDMELLAKKFSHVVDFYLLGGEPFLSPDIKEFVIRARQIFPHTHLYIITNGLLLPKIGEDIFRTINEYGVKIIISEYLPTHKMADEIKEVLEQNHVQYEVRPYDKKQVFNKPLTVNDKSNLEKLCISDQCVNIWNGKIARCPSLMYVEELNQKYGLHFPAEGIYSLDGELSGQVLKEKMKERVALCSYCVKNPIEWGS